MRALLFVPLLAICCFACEDGPQDSSSLVGSRKDFQVETLQSGDIKTSLKSLKGKPVLIDFWATWCGPCRQLTPYVESIYEKYRAKGLEAMAISNENRTDVQRFEKEMPHTMPVYIDFDGSASNAYNVTGLPTVLVINKDGAVSYATVGFSQVDRTAMDIDQAVAKALQ